MGKKFDPKNLLIKGQRFLEIKSKSCPEKALSE